MKKLMMISIVPLVMALAGCSTAAERMAKCESEGVSKIPVMPLSKTDKRA